MFNIVQFKLTEKMISEFRTGFYIKVDPSVSIFYCLQEGLNVGIVRLSLFLLI